MLSHCAVISSLHQKSLYLSIKRQDENQHLHVGGHGFKLKGAYCSLKFWDKLLPLVKKHHYLKITDTKMWKLAKDKIRIQDFQEQLRVVLLLFCMERSYLRWFKQNKTNSLNSQDTLAVSSFRFTTQLSYQFCFSC